MNQPLYTKGTRVICPGCRVDIGTTAKDLFTGSPIEMSAFNFVQDYQPGDRANCKICHASWCSNGFLNTEHSAVMDWSNKRGINESAEV